MDNNETKPLSKEELREVKKHLREVKRQLNINLVRAYHGWWLWHKVTRTKGISNTAVVLLPDNDPETNYLALLYLDQMLSARRHKDAIILTHNPAVIKSAKLFSSRILKVIDFSRKKAEHLMQYYCLYEFDNRFICASLDEPHGRNGSAVVGKRGTTKEEVFVIGVYRVYPFNRPEKPVYESDDSHILEFINIHERVLKNAEEMRPIAEQYDKDADERLRRSL